MFQLVGTIAFRFLSVKKKESAGKSGLLFQVHLASSHEVFIILKDENICLHLFDLCKCDFVLNFSNPEHVKHNTWCHTRIVTNQPV